MSIERPSPAFAIRSADPTDAAAISALLLQSLPQVVDDPDAPSLDVFKASLQADATRERLAAPAFEHWVAIDTAGLCGFVAMRDRSHLYHLFVREDAQRRGIAQALWATARASHPATTITVNASMNALAFYARLGFRPTTPEQVQHGLRFQPMAWQPADHAQA